MKLVTIRVNDLMYDFIRDISEYCGRKYSDIARDLIDVGIGHVEEGVIYLDNLTDRIPFTKLTWMETSERLSLRLDEKQIERAVKNFDSQEATAIREAVRLGYTVLQADIMNFTRNDTHLFWVKPFVESDIKDEAGAKALRRLKSNIQAFNREKNRIKESSG